LAHRFGSFQNAYARAFNIRYKRRGSLFMQSFGRKLVEQEEYFLNGVQYIHLNAVYHSMVKNVNDWKYTSYHAYVSKQESKLTRENVINYFGSLKEFKDFHERMQMVNLQLEPAAFC
jgi:putative transposase